MMKQKILDRRLYLMLPDSVAKRLEAAAEREAETKSAFARRAIIDRLRSLDPKFQPEAA
jgi:predicted transcriptional regulator